MWKLKLDENNNVVLDDNGNPIYIKDDGSEVAIDINQTNQTISRLNGEAKQHREAKEAAENKLKDFEGLDPEKARNAIEVASKIDQKQLMDAGKVDELKAQITAQYEEKLKQEQEATTGAVQKYNNLQLSLAFSRSKFITDKVAVPVHMIERTFGENFKVEDDGTVRGYLNGNAITSKNRIGEKADFDEAIEQLIETYPYKDQILKGTGNSGSGASGAGDAGKRRYSRGEFEKLPASEQAKIAGEMREGKVVIAE